MILIPNPIPQKYAIHTNKHKLRSSDEITCTLPRTQSHSFCHAVVNVGQALRNTFPAPYPRDCRAAKRGIVDDYMIFQNRL